jgi:Chain length determinant protein
MLTTREIPDSSPPAFDQSEQLVRGVFEPPSSFVLSAISRNKWIVLVFAIALALVGFGIGRSSKKTYTASATLQVGQVNPNSPGFYGYVQSAASLATAFSRSISSEPVLDTVQHKLNLAPSKAISRLSAEPIPQAPAFRVIATGPTEYAAIQLANVASGAVIAYEGQSNSANPEAESLLSEYRAASVRLQHDSEALAHIFHRTQGGGSTPKSAVVRIEADKNADAARYRAIGAAYNAAIASQAPRSGLVSLLAGATSASSNRRSRTELYGFLGLLIGIVAGCVVAVLRERLRARGQSRGAKVAAEMQRPKPDLA